MANTKRKHGTFPHFSSSSSESPIAPPRDSKTSLEAPGSSGHHGVFINGNGFSTHARLDLDVLAFREFAQSTKACGGWYPTSRECTIREECRYPGPAHEITIRYPSPCLRRIINAPNSSHRGFAENLMANLY